MPSRPVLIGRGLVTHHHNQPPPTTTNTPQHQHRQTTASTIQNLNQQTHHGSHVHKYRTVQKVTAAIAARKHPDPSRTRKLSQPAPMVLHPTGCGRVGRRRTTSPKRGHRPVTPFRISASRPALRPGSGTRRASESRPPQAGPSSPVVVGGGTEAERPGGDRDVEQRDRS